MQQRRKMTCYLFQAIDLEKHIAKISSRLLKKRWDDDATQILMLGPWRARLDNSLNRSSPAKTVKLRGRNATLFMKQQPVTFCKLNRVSHACRYSISNRVQSILKFSYSFDVFTPLLYSFSSRIFGHFRAYFFILSPYLPSLAPLSVCLRFSAF